MMSGTRGVDNPPTSGVNLDGSPGLVPEVQIDPAIEPTDANMNGKFGGVEMRLCLDHVKRRL
jgi:hypothetical protein